MQTQGGSAAEAAITSPERVFRPSVQVDWNGDGLYTHPLSNLDPFLDSVKVNRALQGSAPEEIILIEGTSVAELNVVLAGEVDGQSLAHMFSPYNTRSPFYGKQVVDREIKYVINVETDSGLVTYPQFVGNIRTISPDRADNSVEFSALDKSDRMRKPIQVPPYAMSEEHIAYGEEDSQLIRSQWLVDHALNLCDAGASDKRPTTKAELGLAEDATDGVQVWVSGNGSYLPTVGWLDNLNADTFPNAGSPMFLANARPHPSAPAGSTPPLGFAGVGYPVLQRYGTPGDQGIIRYWVADQDRITAQAVHYVGFTLNTNGTNGTAFQTINEVIMTEIMLNKGRHWEVVIQNGQMRCRRVNWSSGSRVIENTSANLAIPTGQSNVDCFLMWDATSATGSRLYMRAGSNETGWVTFGSPPSSGGIDGIDQIKGRFSIGQGLNASNFFYATRNSGSAPANDTSFCYRTPKYLALLDQGLNRFTFVPSAKKQEAWKLIQDVSAAEWASSFFDENGVFRFWNWNTVTGKRSSISRIFSMDQVEGLRMTNSSDSVRNVLAVTTKKKRAANVLNVYKSSDPMEFYTPAYTEKSFVIWKDDIVSPLTFYMTKYDTDTVNTNYPNWDENVNHGFAIQYLYGSGGPAGAGWYEDTSKGYPEVRSFFTTDGYLIVRVNNDMSLPIRFASGGPGVDPSPALHIAGTPINDFSETVVLYRNDESIRKYGVKSLELSGDWYQDTAATGQMFDTLLSRTKEPSPATDAITVAGDPRIQLADVVQIVDKQGFGDAITLQILGIDRDFTPEDGLTDTYTVEVVPPPGSTAPPVDPSDPVYRTRKNLCPNPSAANNAKDFYSGTGRVTGVTGMLRTTAYQANAGGGISLPKTQVTPGKTYKMSCYIKSTSSSQDGEVHIDWYSRNGYLSSSNNQTWSVGPAGVVRASAPAAVAPVGADKGFLVVASHDATIQINAILYEEGTTLLPYFDGDSSGAVWDGTQGNSSSRITETV